MPKVLITGITGFTGYHMSEKLFNAGYEVCGISHHSVSQCPPFAHSIYQCSLSDEMRLDFLVKKIKPNYVIHLAAVSFVAFEDIEKIYQVNFLGTRNLLEALCKNDFSIQAVLLASSANVYGNSKSGKLDELAPLIPVNDYSVSKVATEYLASLYRERLPLILVRPFNYTGVGQKENFLIPKIIAHISRKDKTIELGNLNVSRDFLDVRDVVSYYHYLLESTLVSGEVFNICSGYNYTLQQILNDAMEISGHKMQVRVNPDFVRKKDVKVLLGDPSKLSSTIGELAPIHIKDTLTWMLDNVMLK